MALPPAPPPGAPMLPAGTYDGRVVLITGAGTGLGKAMAVEFARLGAGVAVAGRSAEHRASGVAAVEAERVLGPVDVLVNNAAGNFPVPAEDLSLNGWRAVTGIVLDGTFACSTEFARRVIARGGDGAILNIGATYSWTGGPGTAHSAAAKAGVTNLTMSLAVEWAPHGIRVNCLAPGLFPHDDHPAALKASRPDDRATMEATVPAGRVGDLHELGWTATWMCSPYAAYLSGHTLVLDGANWLRRSLCMPEFVPVRDQPGFSRD